MDKTIFGRHSRLVLVAVITLLFCQDLTAELKPNGFGIYEEFGAPLYAVKLESEIPSNKVNDLLTGEHPKKLTLKVLAASVDESQWCRFWTQNIAINISSSELQSLADSILSVCDQTGDNLVIGDEIVFSRESSSLTSLSINDVSFESLNGEGIFEAFLSPFFGASPINNNLKNDLLTQSSESSSAALTFMQSHYSADRASTVRNWITPIEAIAAESQIETETASNLTPDLAEAENYGSGQAGTDLSLQPIAIAINDSNLSASQSALINHTEEVSWSPAQNTTAEDSYYSSNLTDEAVLVSSAYIPHSGEMLAAAAGLEISQLPVREKLNRVSLLDMQEYQNQSLRYVYNFISYPSIAQRRGREGSLRLKVNIDREGNIEEISTLEESDYGELNREAIRAVEKAAPFQPPPLSEDEDLFELLLPIRFTLQ